MADHTQTQSQQSVQENNDKPAGNEPFSIEIEKEKFIEEVRKYRYLWDINSEAYKNRPIKQNSWASFPPYSK